MHQRAAVGVGERREEVAREPQHAREDREPRPVPDARDDQREAGDQIGRGGHAGQAGRDLHRDAGADRRDGHSNAARHSPENSALAMNPRAGLPCSRCR